MATEVFNPKSPSKFLEALILAGVLPISVETPDRDIADEVEAAKAALAVEPPGPERFEEDEPEEEDEEEA